MRSLTRISGGLGLAALLVASGCGDLDITNPNEPDTERALSDPGSVAAIAGGTFRTWFNITQGMESAGPLVTMADSYTASWNNFNMRLYSSIPRSEWKNSLAEAARTSIEHPWYGYYSALSSANDVLKAIRELGLEINSPEETKMVETGAALMQGMTLGYLSLTYDQAFIVDETSDLLSLQLQPRDAVRDAAIAKIDDAIALADANVFDTPDTWTNGTSYSNEQISQIANSFGARILAYFPRNAAENATVDWAQVLAYASNGISSGTPFNFEFTGDGGTSWYDEMKAWSNDPTTMRMDTRVAKLLDPATQVDPWPNPQGNPPPNSPDKRLGDGTYGSVAQANATGSLPATARAGTDYAWFAPAIFRPARGQYHQSNIGQIRYDYAGFSDPAGTGGGFGTVPQMLAAENDLLWAEALIRTGGNLATAATLINKTRVGRGGLPPATTADGVAGLLIKLQYEQDIELPGSGSVPFYNRRRIDGLLPETPRHMPVPAKELGVLQLEFYTFGGPGNPELKVTGGSMAKNVHQIYRDIEKASRRSNRFNRNR
jgi:hypothetical protein